MSRAPARIGLWISLAGLGILLIISGFGVVMAFKIGGVKDITVHGWIALTLAVVFTALLAGGLMWLAFYSNSHGYDDQQGPG